MPFALILIAAVLVVVAFNNTQGALGSALASDVPPYLKWAGAIALVGALGYVPGMRTPSRWLMGLVFLVLIVSNYQRISDTLQQLASAEGSASSGTPQDTAQSPGTAYAAGGDVTAANVTGQDTTTHSGSAISVAGVDPLNPSTYLSAVTSGFGAGAAGAVIGGLVA